MKRPEPRRTSFDADSTASLRARREDETLRLRRFSRALGRRSILLAAAALISVLLTGWISDRSARTMADSLATMDHTRDVLLAIDRFRASLAEAESDARGYVITGNPNLATEFDQIADSVTFHARRLRTLTQNESAARPGETVEALAVHRVELLRQLVRLETQQAEAREIEASILEGERVSEVVYAVVRRLRTQTLQRLESQLNAARAARRFAVYAPWTMCSIAVVMFLLMVLQAAQAFRVETALREELREAVEHEQAARQRAQQADKAKDQFLASVTHDLRTPLTSIIGWCSILESPDARETLLDSGLESISEAARLQSRLVEDLLDVSRIAAGKLTLNLAGTDVANVVEKAVASVSPSAAEKKIAIRKSVPSSPAIANADHERLQQVLANLLSNAIKFTPAGGQIEVSLRSNAGRLQIAVRDTGEGIPRDLLPRIFEAFRQGDTNTGRKGGLGLGLAIAKTIVELHGGTIKAASDGPGKGATFTVDLPATHASGQPVAAGTMNEER